MHEIKDILLEKQKIDPAFDKFIKIRDVSPIKPMSPIKPNAAHQSPHRLAWLRTLPFQGSNTGSNPVGDAMKIRGVIPMFRDSPFSF